MKKLLIIAAVLVATGLSQAWAGHFIDVLPPASATGCTPVSNGYDYNCTTDSGAPAVVLAAPLSPFSRTAAQILALTPTTTGQMVFCSNCSGWNGSKGGVCTSSGVAVGSWIAISSATAVLTCQ